MTFIYHSEETRKDECSLYFSFFHVKRWLGLWFGGSWKIRCLRENPVPDLVKLTFVEDIVQESQRERRAPRESGVARKVRRARG